MQQVFAVGARVMLVNDGRPYAGIQPGTLGRVVPLGNGEDEEEDLVAVEFDGNHGREVMRASRLARVADWQSSEPWPLATGERFIVTDFRPGSPFAEGDVVEVVSPEVGHGGGVAVRRVTGGPRVQMHWTRLHTPEEVKPVPKRSVWDVQRDAFDDDQITVEHDHAETPGRVDIALGHDYVLLSLTSSEVSRLIAALCEARQSLMEAA